MKVFVVIKGAAMDAAGDVLNTLGVFSKKMDARKVMLDDFKSQEYDKNNCDEYVVEEDFIYVVGSLGFSYDHYWVEIVEQEVK